MSDNSARLNLPFILPSQAQKHVTHNEALQVLDAVTQLVIEDTLSSPPDSPGEGNCYSIGTGASGAWDGYGGKIAVWQDSAWAFLTPQAGWRGFFRTLGRILVYSGSGWEEQALPPQIIAEQLGVNSTPDSTNRLSVAADASLFNNAGSDHRLKINKAAADNTASLLFQTGWSGRAEMGTSGSDTFSLKVSGDGSNWTTGLSITSAGQVLQPNKPAGRVRLSSRSLAISSGTITGFDTLVMGQGGIALGQTLSDGRQTLKVPVEGLYAVSVYISGSTAVDYAVTVIDTVNNEFLKLYPGTASTFETTRYSVLKLSAGVELSISHTGSAVLGVLGRAALIDLHLL
ncbi:DUF2793 domain-containing protein [Rhizobium paknamense]|uniref:DUF2793 domain-containing protein n=1 Tax=Rhizobium paknamense TaxID=1206817 RepID=A0ABU0IG50_9HYPH|nr:DUF2793 domain-containing protein [Rhizobium paknamense]MDQ0457121.1 hypothetical protein [Rhizobium paknamense]